MSQVQNVLTSYQTALYVSAEEAELCVDVVMMDSRNQKIKEFVVQQVPVMTQMILEMAMAMGEIAVLMWSMT